jgi:hypothetical protein
VVCADRSSAAVGATYGHVLADEAELDDADYSAVRFSTAYSGV